MSLNFAGSQKTQHKHEDFFKRKFKIFLEVFQDEAKKRILFESVKFLMRL